MYILKINHICIFAVLNAERRSFFLLPSNIGNPKKIRREEEDKTLTSNIMSW